MPPAADVYETASPEETAALGAALARELAPGDVVLVAGEMGAGKTTFVRGAARELGVTGPVTSPTFTIGRRYRGRVPVSHLDLHRLSGLDEEDPALLADYIDGEAIAFVEWPEIAALDRVARRVTLTHLGGDRRRVQISEAQPSGHARPEAESPHQDAGPEIPRR